jgi:putative heme degradation protein
VIKDDPEEISKIIGKRKEGKGKRKKVRERIVSIYGVQLSGG